MQDTNIQTTKILKLFDHKQVSKATIFNIKSKSFFILTVFQLFIVENKNRFFKINFYLFLALLL